jgi:hypothetical protein
MYYTALDTRQTDTPDRHPTPMWVSGLSYLPTIVAQMNARQTDTPDTPDTRQTRP